MNPRDEKKGLPTFVTDSTLGRLAKWIRLAGLNVLMDSSTPHPAKLKLLAMEEKRWILTRSRNVYRKLGPRSCLFIRSNDPIEQVRQVVQHFGIRRLWIRPLTRCPKCNLTMASASREQVVGLVPDYVWQKHDRFRRCDGCDRIYWAGTHAKRIGQCIDRLFARP